MLLQLLLIVVIGLGAPAMAWSSASDLNYVCQGEPLVAELNAGAVDAPGIANSSQGTAPGAFVVLHWHGLTLQLPRTNIAGVPSYSDGRWWWQVNDPDQPTFAQRRGSIEHYSCTRAMATETTDG